LDHPSRHFCQWLHARFRTRILSSLLTAAVPHGIHTRFPLSQPPCIYLPFDSSQTHREVLLKPNVVDMKLLLTASTFLSPTIRLEHSSWNTNADQLYWYFTTHYWYFSANSACAYNNISNCWKQHNGY
jgi:hypothetical protein